MKKAELIRQVAKASGGTLNERAVARVLDAAFAVIGEAIREDRRFVWPGFGTFTVKERAARPGRNPQTGEAMRIAASKTVGFRPSSGLRQSLSGRP